MHKTIFITGSTDGIGKLTAISLAQQGHTIYLHGRNKEKLDRVIHEIKSITNNESIDGFIGDLSEISQVKQLALDVSERVDSLDVIINNAGVYKSAKDYNAHQIDMRFMVNYIAPFLLTTELLTLLVRSTDPRIINLSSAAQAPVSMGALQGGQSVNTHQSYAQSKLALTMWSMALAKTHPDLTVIPVNPGSLLNTKMVREGFGHTRSSADVGADILTYLATADDLKKYSGVYYDNDLGSFSRAHEDAYNDEKINNLIENKNHLINQ